MIFELRSYEPFNFVLIDFEILLYLSRATYIYYRILCFLIYESLKYNILSSKDDIKIGVTL